MKELQTIESVKASFNEFLVKNDYRKTSERFAILEHIGKIEGHFTAEMFYDSMKVDFRVSLASVYNNFELLLKAGLIVRHQINSTSALYERTFNIQPHHHLVCSNCGCIKEFTDKNLKTYIENKKYKYFVPTHFSLYIYGLCNRCKKQMISDKK